MSNPSAVLPHVAEGEVIKGFGRGSKELGIPTANFPEDVVEHLPDSISTGVYFGYAKINNGPVYKMVMSVGWNPFYNNKKKSMETHILHKFDDDFYGKIMKVIMVGYVRPERNFSSLEELIKEINNDIDIARKELDKEEIVVFKNHEKFI